MQPTTAAYNMTLQKNSEYPTLTDFRENRITESNGQYENPENKTKGFLSIKTERKIIF